MEDFFGGFCLPSCRVSRLGGVINTSTHIAQLPDKESGLPDGYECQQKRECRCGVCRRPLPSGFFFAVTVARIFGFCIMFFGWAIIDIAWNGRKRRRESDTYNHGTEY